MGKKREEKKRRRRRKKEEEKKKKIQVWNSCLEVWNLCLEVWNSCLELLDLLVRKTLTHQYMCILVGSSQSQVSTGTQCCF